MEKGLLTRAVNYHGKELASLLVGSPAFESMDPQDFDYKLYESRVIVAEDEKNKLLLEGFISQNAEALFHTRVMEKRMIERDGREEEEKEKLCGLLPPFELFAGVSKTDRIAHFFESLAVDDVLICSIVAKNASGMLVYVVCFSSAQKSRFLQDLKIKAVCPIAETEGTTGLRPGSYIRAYVMDINEDSHRLIIGLRPPPEKESLFSGVSFGLLSSDKELPTVFHHTLQTADDDIPFDEFLEKSAGFQNPNNVEYLAKELEITPKLSSFMRGLRKNINPEVKATSLRKKQSYNWAFRHVASGIKYFKSGNNIEAFQCLNQALNIDANNVEGLVARGALYANNGSFEKAISDFEKALRIDNGHKNARKYLCETYSALARTYKNNEDFTKASEAYEKIIFVDPDHREAIDSIKLLKDRKLSPASNEAVEPLNIPDKGNKLNISLDEYNENSIDSRMSKNIKKRKNKKNNRRSSSSEFTSDSDSSSNSSSSSSSSSISSFSSRRPRGKKRKDKKRRSKRKNKKSKSFSKKDKSSSPFSEKLLDERRPDIQSCSSTSNNSQILFDEKKVSAQGSTVENKFSRDILPKFKKCISNPEQKSVEYGEDLSHKSINTDVSSNFKASPRQSFTTCPPSPRNQVYSKISTQFQASSSFTEASNSEYDKGIAEVLKHTWADKRNIESVSSHSSSIIHRRRRSSTSSEHGRRKRHKTKKKSKKKSNKPSKSKRRKSPSPISSLSENDTLSRKLTNFFREADFQGEEEHVRNCRKDRQETKLSSVCDYSTVRDGINTEEKKDANQEISYSLGEPSSVLKRFKLSDEASRKSPEEFYSHSSKNSNNYPSATSKYTQLSSQSHYDCDWSNGATSKNISENITEQRMVRRLDSRSRSRSRSNSQSNSLRGRSKSSVKSYSKDTVVALDPRRKERSRSSSYDDRRAHSKTKYRSRSRSSSSERQYHKSRTRSLYDHRKEYSPPIIHDDRTYHKRPQYRNYSEKQSSGKSATYFQHKSRERIYERKPNDKDGIKASPVYQPNTDKDVQQRREESTSIKKEPQIIIPGKSSLDDLEAFVNAKRKDKMNKIKKRFSGGGFQERK